MKKAKLVLISVLAVLVLGASTSSAALKDYFVDTDWLAENRDSVKVVDVRATPLYLLGHIKGAVNINRDEFLDKRRGVKSLVPTAAAVAKLLDEYGITPDTLVVAYAEDDNPYSARFVWMLRFHGHEKSFVLDGGYDKWDAEGRDTANIPGGVTPSKGYAVTESCDIRAEADYLLSRLENASVVVWDTRTPEEYLGTKVRADRGGHIPGVIHLNWTELQKEVDGVKVLKSEEELRTLLTASGITPDKEVIAHCQTGIRSSYATLVLLALDYPVAKNYDGSWIEWANDEFFPIVDPSRAPSN